MIGEWKLNEQYKVEEYFVDGKLVAWLQKRPPYCDRGHWQVNADVPHLDAADGFPRYYMNYDVAKSETEAWVEWRLSKEEKYAEANDKAGSNR